MFKLENHSLIQRIDYILVMSNSLLRSKRLQTTLARTLRILTLLAAPC